LRILDFPTLLIVVLSSLYLGAVGLFGVALIPANDPSTAWIFVVVGFSGVWQLLRQRFW